MVIVCLCAHFSVKKYLHTDFSLYTWPHNAASRDRATARSTGGALAGVKSLNINKFYSVGGKNHCANLSPMAGENNNTNDASSKDESIEARFGIRIAERAS